MKIPGFTAESSLYEGREYRESARFGRTSENLLEPAMGAVGKIMCRICGLTDDQRYCNECIRWINS